MRKLNATVVATAMTLAIGMGAAAPASALSGPAPAATRVSILTTLVQQGVITQAQADAIRIAKKPLRKQWAAARRAALAQLVADNVITAGQAQRISRMGKKVRKGQLVHRLGLTQTQAASVSNALRIAKASTVTSRLALINSMLSQGTLTEAQAQAYISALVARQR